MKKIISILIVLVVGLYLCIEMTPERQSLVISNAINVKYLDSTVLERKNSYDIDALDKEIVDEVDEEVNDESSVELKEKKEVEVIDEDESKPVEPIISSSKIVSSSPKVEEAKETFDGRISAYGPDCSGCSGYLGSGRYVGDGNIYYNDATYGKVRIVAGDAKYSYGTIVKIKDKTGEFLAIVLDRGGGVGIGKKFAFDLLFTSENEASKYGISNASFEILRYGY